MATGHYDLKKAKNGQFHFNLKAGNGEIILTSEMYASKASAENGITSVQNNAPHGNHKQPSVRAAGMMRGFFRQTEKPQALPVCALLLKTI